jgi:hypothetical protein
MTMPHFDAVRNTYPSDCSSWLALMLFAHGIV